MHPPRPAAAQGLHWSGFHHRQLVFAVAHNRKLSSASPVHALPRGLVTSLPFDEIPAHSLDQPKPSWLRVPCSANEAPWGSLHRTIQPLFGNSCGSRKIAPPLDVTRSTAASMSPTLK